MRENPAAQAYLIVGGVSPILDMTWWWGTVAVHNATVRIGYLVHLHHALCKSEMIQFNTGEVEAGW